MILNDTKSGTMVGGKNKRDRLNLMVLHWQASITEKGRIHQVIGGKHRNT